MACGSSVVRGQTAASSTEASTNSSLNPSAAVLCPLKMQEPDKRPYTLFNPTPVEHMRELSADRPDKTDSPFTVDVGHFQMEMDFVNYTGDSTSGIKMEEYQIAPMNLKLGLLSNLDCQLVFSPWQSQRVEDTSTRVAGRQSGFGDITPRLKLNLVGNDGGFFGLALIPFVKMPTAQDHLGNGFFEGGIGIPYTLNISNWDVGFQTTVSVMHDSNGSGYHAEIANSVSAGHAIIGDLDCHVEFFSSVSRERNAEWIGTFDTWLTYKINENLVLDGGVYIGVSKSAADWHPWIGMTRRF